MWTYFFYIRRNAGEQTINKWAPINPYDYGLRCIILGRREISAPTQLTAQSNETSVTLTWHDNSDNEMGFLIYRSDDGTNFEIIDIIWTNGNGTGQMSYVDNNVNLGDIYWYKIQAFAQNFYSDESDIIVVRIGLNAPSHLNYEVNPQYSAITLTWQDNSNYEDGYILEEQHAGSDWQVLDTLEANTESYTHYVSRYTDHWYRLYGYSSTYDVYSDTVYTWATTSPILSDEVLSIMLHTKICSVKTTPYGQFTTMVYSTLLTTA